MKPPKSFNTAVDFNGNQIHNVVIHNLFSHPGTVGNPPKEGQLYYNISNSPTIGKRLFLWNGSAWLDLAYISADITNRIEVLENESLPDIVLKYGGIEVVDSTITVQANAFNWRLDKVAFINQQFFSASIISASDNFYRSDILVGDNTGSYYIVEGIEDDLLAPIPEVPNGMILLAVIPVFGSIIQEPIFPPTITDYISKSAQKEVAINSWYDGESFVFLPMGGTSYKIQTISSSGYIGKTYSIFENPFSGQEISITNQTGASFLIKHNASVTGAHRSFYFSNEADFTLEQNCTVKFRFIDNSWNYVGVLITSIYVRAPYNIFKFVQKGVGNIDVYNDEIGDIFSGWSNDGTIRYTEAIWLGGDLSNSDNFTPLAQTQL